MDQEVRLRAATYGIPPIVHMVQGDNGRSLKMILEDFEVEDYYDCVVAIHRPDDSYYEIEGMAIPAGNYVSAPAYQAITRPGKVECQLKVSMPGMLISTFDFTIMVHESVVGLPVEQLGYDIYDLIEAAETITPSPGLTDDIKQALLDCFEHVAWTDEHGQDYVDALEAALYPPANLLSISAVYTQSGTVYDTDTLDSLRDDLVVTAHYDDSSSEVVTAYTLSGTLVGGTSTITVSYGGKTTTFTVNVYQPAELVSISAVYTQSGTVYDTDSLDSLKSDLAVTALYDDQSTATVTNYTLSGTLTTGTSTITVSYGGKTTTFTVTVTHDTTILLKNWDFTNSLIDTVDGDEATLTNTATVTQTSNGLLFNSQGGYSTCGYATFTDLIPAGGNVKIEIDVASMTKNFTSGSHGRLFMWSNTNGFIYKKDGSWQAYNGSWTGATEFTDATLPSGKTITIEVGASGVTNCYIGEDLVVTVNLNVSSAITCYLAQAEQAYTEMLITGLRVYGEE